MSVIMQMYEAKRLHRLNPQDYPTDAEIMRMVNRGYNELCSKMIDEYNGGNVANKFEINKKYHHIASSCTNIMPRNKIEVYSIIPDIRGRATKVVSGTFQIGDDFTLTYSDPGHYEELVPVVYNIGALSNTGSITVRGTGKLTFTPPVLGWIIGDICVRIGDILTDNGTGYKFEIIKLLENNITVQSRNPRNKFSHHQFAAVDIWNYYSMWPGTSDPPVESKRHCEHKFVNVSFAGLNMRCKFCDMSEDDYKFSTQVNKLENT